MDKPSLARQISEATIRMEILHFNDLVIENFVKTGEVMIFFDQAYIDAGIPGTLKDAVKEGIKYLKDNYNSIAYTGTYSETEAGRMISFLYVSDDKEEWEDDRALLRQNRTFAYVVNLDIPEYSELGMISFTNAPCLKRKF